MSLTESARRFFDEACGDLLQAKALAVAALRSVTKVFLKNLWRTWRSQTIAEMLPMGCLSLSLLLGSSTWPSLLPLPAHPIIATMMQVTPDGILPSGMQQEGPWAPHDPNHREPPEGWVCMNPGPGVPKDHECDCAHKCVVAPPTQTSCDEDGENCTEYPNPQAGERSVQENAKCAVWCHPKHCGCKVEGCSTT